MSYNSVMDHHTLNKVPQLALCLKNSFFFCLSQILYPYKVLSYYCHVTAIGLLTAYLLDIQVIDPNDELPVTDTFPCETKVTL